MKRVIALQARKLLYASILIVAVYWPQAAYSGAASSHLDVVVKAPDRVPIRYLMTSAHDVETMPLDRSVETYLGSIWKIFSYFYLIESGIHPRDYVCRGQNPDDVFCCEKGSQVDLDSALVKSCSPYFAPGRLEIPDQVWSQFWTSHVHLSYEWLTNLSSLTPERKVPVFELVEALGMLRKFDQSFKKINQTLGRVPIDGTAKGAIKDLGLLLRIKTYTWESGDQEGRFIGGFAGWTQDGSVIWAGGRGSGKSVIKTWSKDILSLSHLWVRPESEDCVNVAYFDRYPIKSVKNALTNESVPNGSLYGQYVVSFLNDNQLVIESRGDLTLTETKGNGPKISAVFKMSEYIARVIDREVSTSPLEATRALSVAMRTHLYQNAKYLGGCFATKDSTSMQRVSTNPPSFVAMKVAQWGDRLIVKGVPRLRYHSDTSGPNILSWKQAVTLAKDGLSFDEILRAAYPAGSLAIAEDRGLQACRSLLKVQSWLSVRRVLWVRRLSGIQGFQEPQDLKICRSPSSQPYSDLKNNIIYMRDFGDVEDQLTVAHEYLHMAFKHHPRVSDEKFIEQLAQELVLNPVKEVPYETID